MKIRQIILFGCLVTVCILLVGCGKPSSSSDEKNTQIMEPSSTDIVKESVEDEQTMNEMEALEEEVGFTVEETMEQQGNDLEVEDNDEIAETTEAITADTVEEAVVDNQTIDEMETLEGNIELAAEGTVERQGNEIGMEGIDETAENMGKEYTVNEDGTYTCDGKIYKYKIALTGRGPGAVCDTRYIVLTNYAGLRYEDVEMSFISSSGNGVMLETVVLGVEALKDE